MKAIFLSLMLSSAALAQISSGSFYGQILDESGALVANAHITAQQKSTGFVRSVVSAVTNVSRRSDCGSTIRKSGRRYGFE